MRGAAAGALAALVALAAGCEIVAGIKSRPLADGRGGSTGQAGAGGTSGTGGQAGRGGSVGGGGASGSAVAQNGAPCSSLNARACAGNNTVQKLLCGAMFWGANGECVATERCDTRSGATAGTCVAIVPECVGRSPGDHVCVGTAVHACGPDLVTTALITACAHPMPECSNAACTCTATTCDDVCARLDSDRNHCGSCDHACDSDCVGSRCRQTLATVPQTNASGRAIVLDGANVYWTNPDNGGVMRVPRQGGTPVVVASISPIGGGGGAMAIDAARVYWLAQGAVWSAPKDGQDQIANRLATVAGSSIAVDAAGIYFTSCCGATNTLTRTDLDGNNSTALATVGTYPGGVAVVGNAVYWTESSIPWRTVVGSGTKNMAVASGGSANPGGRIALNANSVYWVVSSSRSVMRSDLNLENASTLVPGGGMGTSGTLFQSIVVDADGIYWTGPAVNRAGLAGESPTVLATDLTLTGAIAVDATSVYVTTASGQIVKLEK